MSAFCKDCGAVASYGHELGHKSDCPALERAARIGRIYNKMPKGDDAGCTIGPGEIDEAQMAADFASIPDRVDGPMLRARRLVEDHISHYGMVPHPDRIKEAIATELGLAEIRGADRARAQLRAVPQTAGKPTREATPTWERRWPHDQPNGWNLDAAGFLKIVQDSPMLWICLGRAKYLELRIDTRDGGFNLYDRDGKPLNPDDVVEAAKQAIERYGDASQLSRPQQAGEK